MVVGAATGVVVIDGDTVVVVVTVAVVAVAVSDDKELEVLEIGVAVVESIGRYRNLPLCPPYGSPRRPSQSPTFATYLKENRNIET